MYPHALRQRKILLINDQPSVAQMLVMLLKTKGYQIQFAASKEEGIKALSPQTDLILLDLLSSIEDVVSCCEYVKTNPQTRHIPVIVLNTAVHREDKIQILQLGVDDYINKPFETEELFVRVDAVLRRNNSVNAIIDHQRQIHNQQEIKAIIHQHRIVPYFQPIYRLESKSIIGVEMFSRPQTRTHLSNPEVFFKEALRAGLYMDVEMLAWQRALDIFNQAGGAKTYQLFLNCNPFLVENDKFAEVKDIVSKAHVSPQQVCLEITERSAIGEYGMFCERLNEYRDGGFKIAVDDVGGGYSSLETIVQTRPHVIKIDKHIITGLSDDAIKRSIVKLLVSFCRENGIMAVAEGIETKSDLDAVVELGVEAAQGYYFCRPTENLSTCFV